MNNQDFHQFISTIPNMKASTCDYLLGASHLAMIINDHTGYEILRDFSEISIGMFYAQVDGFGNFDTCLIEDISA